MTEKTSQIKVLEALDWEPSVEAEQLSVTVDDNIVTPKGHVASYYAKREAVRVTQAVSGVKAVVDELEVSLPLPSERKDEDLVRAALDALAWNINVPKDAIKITVRQGHVTLEGEVEWHYQRTAAEFGIQSLISVKRLSNEIRIAPRVSGQKVHDKIEAALKRAAELDAKDIFVEVHGSIVTLKGKVHSFAERQQAERAAWAAPGVTHVHDNLVLVASA